MAKIIKGKDWVPEGIAELEPAALRVAKGTKSTLVVAGPGAGKTELLAQRASYLLSTGACIFPKRILAISFKRDAARNLKERVRLRCGPELSRRFDSMTFDAFSKSLVDRFRVAAPKRYRPSPDYELDFTIERRLQDRLISLLTLDAGFDMQDIYSLSAQTVYREEFIGRSLSRDGPKLESVEEKVADALWLNLIGSAPSNLDFPMIGRLAELILNSNPLVLTALRSTYSHIFLDEFQDTTDVQFAVTVAAFHGSKAIITAVGDDKQRIMAWAGALGTVFEDFCREFCATREILLLNHRSAPELVRIQSHFIEILSPGSVSPRAAKEKLDGECRVLVFQDHKHEAHWIAGFVEELMEREDLEPRDICILTRNRPAQYTSFVADALAKREIASRVETDLQDLLAEPLSTLIIAFLKIALSDRAQDAWSEAIQIVFETTGTDEGSGEASRLEAKLATFLRDMRSHIEEIDVEEKETLRVLKKLVHYVGEEQYRLIHPQYRQGNYFEDVLAKIGAQLCNCRKKSANWLLAVELFEGRRCVPIMTIHKSKGLEYNTVIFVGLEDSALWSYVNNAEEEKRTFFVAFSRAIQRAIFTFCEVRERPGRGIENQSRHKIGIFYDTLQAAGIEAEEISME